MSSQIASLQRKSGNIIIYSLISLALSILAIIVFIALLALSGNSIILDGLFQNVFLVFFTDSTAFVNIFYSATPLVFTALAVAVAFQAGLFNIGGQGQMILGGVYTAAWGTVLISSIYASLGWNFLLSPLFMIPTSMIIGILAGGFWGFIPGVLKAKTGAHEVITTIMLNQIAASLVRYLVGTIDYSPFISQEEQKYGQTDPIIESARFPPVFAEISNFFNWGFIIAIIAILVTYYVIYKTNFGYKLRAVGLNPEAAEAAGINSKRMIIYALTLSGAIAGLGGAVYVMGTLPYRYFLDYEGSLGFDGIAVSLIGFNNPIGIAIAAIFFGYLDQSQAQLDKTSIPPDLVFVFQAWVIIFAVAPALSKMIYDKLKQTGYQFNKKLSPILEKIFGERDAPDPDEHENPNLSKEEQS